MAVSANAKMTHEQWRIKWRDALGTGALDPGQNGLHTVCQSNFLLDFIMQLSSWINILRYIKMKQLTYFIMQVWGKKLKIVSALLIMKFV